MSILVKALRYLSRKSLLQELNSVGKIHPSLKIGNTHDFELNRDLKSFVIEENVKLYNHVNITISANSILTIGKNTTINKYTSVVSLEKVIIGSDCLIGENVKIYDNNHKIEIKENLQFASHKEFNTAPVIIGNNCWLGSNVTILKGVTIGDNSIIGAGCVIFKNVPPNTTVINKQDLLFKTK